jgi:hypothetical protein
MAGGGDIIPRVSLPTTQDNHVYTTTELDGELRQGEIITGITQYTWDEQSEEVIVLRHSFALIASQDCDLLWDYEARSKEEATDLNGVLLFEAELWSKVKPAVGGRDIWKPLGQNKNERYQFLEAIDPACDLYGYGIPALVVDFKRVFTIGSGEVERQLRLRDGIARRRCRLVPPYREQVQTRAAFYLSRVGLPEPHKVPPSA